MKIWNYVFLFTTMVVVLEFMGIPTGLSSTLLRFGIEINVNSGSIEADIVNSSSYILIIATIAASLIGSVVVGFFTKTFDTRLISVPIITTVFVIFSSTAWVLIKYVDSLGQGWLTAIVATIFIPLGIGYVLSIIDYYNGFY